MQNNDLNTNGLYCPSLEKDACGIGIIVNLNNNRSHKLVSDALHMLAKMSHRGATGYEENTGDGAGILTHIPHRLLVRESNDNLPRQGTYGVGMIFFPNEPLSIDICKTEIQSSIDHLGFRLLGYRIVPTDNRELGRGALKTEPHIEQVIVVPKDESISGKALERRLYFLRAAIKRSVYRKFPEWRDLFYIPSFSSRTVVYKGQLTPHQLSHYYSDLNDPAFESALALVHSRFSTNTVPKWKLAQPFRCIAHNGEINTIQGNLNWWRAREEGLRSPYYSQEELETILPLCNKGISDSGNFDRVLEFLTMNGRSIARSLIMMIPEAWQEDPDFDETKHDFYRFHENMIEPWDGPASICFTDGVLAGATVDRNGLRPSRYLLTDDNTLILASEAGCIDIPPEKVVMKSQLEPGKILIADLEQHRIIDDDELKERICSSAPYSTLLEKFFFPIDDLPAPSNGRTTEEMNPEDRLWRKRMFGMTREDQELIVRAMSEKGKEPIGSMGADIPLAVLSKTPQHVSHYLRQDFAQVTNPPIDSLRERAFMSLKCTLGPSYRVLGEVDELENVISLNSPVLNFNQLAKTLAFFKGESVTLDMVFDPTSGQSLEDAIDHLTVKAIHAASMDRKLIYMSHRQADEKNVPVPSLLLAGAIHQALIRLGLRRRCTLLVDGCDIWETHHVATLLGYGTDAVVPRLALEVSDEIIGAMGTRHYLKALDKGLLKIMSKLGVSTVASYKGAQTFEALGISDEVVNKCFTETISRIGGMTFNMFENECTDRHKEAFNTRKSLLENHGVFQWRPGGEYHLFNPKSIHYLQHATRTGDFELYKKYTREINSTEEAFCTLRSLFTFRKGEPIPLGEVEPAEQIMRRFATGAMSFGSLSYEAHSTLAIAMNRIGGKSNSGEGGEDPSRYKLNYNGDSERSAIKQVASGRFGVTIQYLNEADEIQIKMAQGAKPGEGGQLPGHKVDDWIARVRHSTPGVGLISPPPHHDIYSIEDLAQLIFDLKNANRDARISVKLVSKAGVGIIASGVAKGKAEHILISGSDGGTGASPLSSIRHAGLPWELGLSETHQTLVKNKLRDRVTLQCDGQIRTGRDLAIATLLGAEEWGVATAALVVEGCLLMRKCHLNTCPVGVATQNPELRKKFKGDPDHLVNYFNFLAEDLREIMASLGFRTVDEMVGQSQMLRTREDIGHPKAASLDLSAVFHKEVPIPGMALTHRRAQNHNLDMTADRTIIRKSKVAIERGEKVSIKLPVDSTNRALGTMLSSVIVRRYGPAGLPEDTINIHLRGSAGQSCGAFLSPGTTITLDGDTNDYMGKGLSGGKIVMRKDKRSPFKAEENAIVGNVALYGATSGQVFINGIAGQRFAVRNSGATAVVEGIGANGCEYMTGGKVIILGAIGKNFAAGMSGGVAYIYDTGDTEHNINKKLIHIETPKSNEIDEIYSLISSHYTLTNSASAERLLQDWDNAAGRFIKVIPTEYKKAIAKTKSIKPANTKAQSANV